MTRLLAFVFVASLLLLASCATQQVRRCTDPGDTPALHYVAGMEALEQNNVNDAKKRFERALYCYETFLPAYGGLAIVHSQAAAFQRDPDLGAAERKKAIECLDKAGKSTKAEELFAYYLSVIRVRSSMCGKDWLQSAKYAHDMAKLCSVDGLNVPYYQRTESADYFMGLACLKARDFEEARKLFSMVLKAGPQGKWQVYADRELKRTDRIARAVAGVTVGDIGKGIAVQGTITRGDLAVLLVRELKIGMLFAGRIPTSRTHAKQQEVFPSDLTGCPFRDDIATVMKWKVRGMEPKYDETTKTYLFKPLEPVNRGEMAFVLEDVLILVAGDESVTRAYIGHERSPFADVRPTSPMYNAVMNVTTRGLMEGNPAGEFKPDEPVSGADAVLAIRELKQKTDIH